MSTASVTSSSYALVVYGIFQQNSSFVLTRLRQYCVNFYKAVKLQSPLYCIKQN